METKVVSISLGGVASLLGKEVGDIEKLMSGVDGKPMTQEQIESAILDEIDEAISGRVSAAQTQANKQAHGEALRKSLSKKQKELAEMYGVEAGKTLDDTINNIVAKVESEKPGDKLSDADVRKSKAYIDDVGKLRTAVTEAETALTQEREKNRRSLLHRDLTMAVPALLKENNFLVPEDAKVLDTHLTTLFSKLDNDQIELRYNEETKSYVPFNRAEDTPLRDARFKDVSFKDHVLNNASSIFMKEKSQRKAPGNDKTPPPGGGNGEGGKYDFSHIKTTEEVFQAINRSTSKEEKAALREHYTKNISKEPEPQPQE